MLESITRKKKIKNVLKQESKQVGNKRQRWFFCEVCFIECRHHVHSTFPPFCSFSKAQKQLRENTKQIPITHMDSIPHINIAIIIIFRNLINVLHFGGRTGK